MSNGHPVHFNLVAAAHQVMLERGFQPDFPKGTDTELAAIEAHPEPPAAPGAQDLRNLLWSSIDNDTSKDLDQIEWAEQLSDGRIRILVGVADVDARVAKDTVIDSHARSETTSVYTGVKVFPMLPAELSEGLTSLNENEDRVAVVIEYVVDAAGTTSDGKAYRALVRNRAQLAYNGVGAWLEGRGDAPAKVAANADLAAQLKLQDTAAQRMVQGRFQHGALNLETIETRPVMLKDQAVDIARQEKNRATSLIEEFMVAANGVIAKTFEEAGVASIRRIVRTPKRWDRIVELANGDLWVHNRTAALRIPADDLKAVLAGTRSAVDVETFDEMDGLYGTLSASSPLPSLIQGDDGRLWFATDAGLAWLDPARRGNALPMPPVHVRSLVADGTNYDLAARPQLASRNKLVELTYSATALNLRHFEQGQMATRFARPGQAIPDFDEWYPADNSINPETMRIFTALTSIDEDNPLDLLDLTQLGDIEIDPDILAFMRTEAQWLTLYRYSFLNISVYCNEVMMEQDKYIVTPELMVQFVEPQSLRDTFHVRFAIFQRPRLLPDAAKARLRNNCAATTKLFLALDQTIPERFALACLPGNYMKSTLYNAIAYDIDNRFDISRNGPMVQFNTVMSLTLNAHSENRT